MNKIYLTSDLHLQHNKPFLYEPRGFSSIEDHDRTIINNINKVVEENDILYSLGDEFLINNEKGIELFNEIKCKNIYIAIGNHTTNKRIELLKALPHVQDVQIGYRLKSGKWSFILSHYPQIVYNGDDPKKIASLCGHSHTPDPWLHWAAARAYHVELDAHNNFPITIEQIKEDIRTHKSGN